MTTPRVILFDVMDTLVRDPVWEVLPALFDCTLQELRQLRDPEVWHRFECGEIDEATFGSTYVPESDVGWNYDELVARMREGYQLVDGIEPLLEELRRAKIPMAALSNYPVWWRFIEEKLTLSRWIDWSFVSCRTGLRKPHPDAYLRAAQALELDPQDCLFVDDREDNVCGARDVGMQAVRFGDAPSLRRELVRLGIL